MSPTFHCLPSQLSFICISPEKPPTSWACLFGSSTIVASFWVTSRVSVPLVGGSPAPSKLVDFTVNSPPTWYPSWSWSWVALERNDVQTWQLESTTCIQPSVSPVAIMYA
jgi:hypothetical protein